MKRAFVVLAAWLLFGASSPCGQPIRSAVHGQPWGNDFTAVVADTGARAPHVPGANPTRAAMMAQSFGLELRPQWSGANELQVQVNNWTKSSLVLDQLVVELALSGFPPCRFNYERRLELGPTATITPTVADSNAAQDCLARQGGVSANVLQFVHPIECSGAGRANIFKAKAELEVQDRTVRNQTCWLIVVQGP